jgi:hypothetical protein
VAADFTTSTVLLLLTCWILSRFSSGVMGGGGKKVSMYSGNSSPGFGKVNCVMPDGL